MIRLAQMCDIEITRKTTYMCDLGDCVVDHWEDNGSSGVVCIREFVFEGISIVPGDDTEIGNIELTISGM